MIKAELEGNIDVINFETDTLNAIISEETKDEINSIIQAGSSKMIIDLNNVRYIDSSGFGCLLSVLRSAKSNYCNLKYCSITPEVMKVLELLHLNTVFTIYPDRETCIASF